MGSCGCVGVGACVGVGVGACVGLGSCVMHECMCWRVCMRVLERVWQRGCVCVCARAGECVFVWV